MSPPVASKDLKDGPQALGNDDRFNSQSSFALSGNSSQNSIQVPVSDSIIKPDSVAPRYPEYRPNDSIRSPLVIPINRRLETLAVFGHGSSIIVLPFFYFFLWCFPIFWPFLLIYTFRFYLFDRTPSNGKGFNRYSTLIQNLGVYKHFANYYPVKLHKTVDLIPTTSQIEARSEEFDLPWILRILAPSMLLAVLGKIGILKKKPITIQKEIRTGPRYIFGYHPHGVIAMGALSGFATEGASFSHHFPGIRCFLTTLVNQFQLPFYRDYLMSLGCTAVTKRNISSLLNQGHSVVIVVGGATESLLAKPGLNSIVLNRRKGFVKLALQSAGKFDESDMCLVPVYAFGENNIYDVYYTNDSQQYSKNDGYIRKLLKMFQLWLKRNVGFTLPIIASRGLFNYDFGLLPYRRPINIVVGEPIPVYRLNGNKFGDTVTQAEVDHYHTQYVKSLGDLFEKHKKDFLAPYDHDLSIVE
ncbi:hypothetical protein OGAPHI_002292 [Ogataea philodendri]|uniref:Diacylglycerol O-acyltransferase n=1 Tax=Ogataea philodendri TaxID=1378263 RepID=A0A9P8T6W8_9ASCO|nr:uncharacterized protein OGAPHI_002292 [Ogataea philodendri]KAH3668538.1 hypothetical protein OGAPHI_002292 [Ogataea philodendri]